MDWFNLQFIVMIALMLSLLVTAHEYGHYLFARLMGMDVEEFAVGLGRPYWTYMVRKGTKYTLRPIPLGGFVRVKGMNPEEDGSEVKIPNGFYSKSPYARFMVLVAGPLFSVLAGLAILIPLHTAHGRRVAGTTVGTLLVDKPAVRAGMKLGDKIVKIDGVPVATMFDVVSNIREKGGETITIEALRDGTPQTFSVVPELEKEPSPYATNPFRVPTEMRRQAKIGLGASQKDSVLIKVPIGQAISDAVVWPVEMAVGLVKAILTPTKFKENVGGPGTIFVESYGAAKQGLDYFVELAALLSISLGIFNLLPIPPLDGGQMVMAVVEMLRRGRRVSIKIQWAYQSVGLVLVGMLIVGVIVADISRYTKPPDSAAVKSK